MRRSPWWLAAFAVAACSAPRRDYSAYQDSGAPPAEDTSVEDVPAVDTAPPYPDGPYDFHHKGDVFPNVHFQGYRDGVGAWTDFWMSDDWDPDGSKGIHAILVNVTAAWCPGCNELAKSLPSLYASYAPRGAHFIAYMIDEVDVTPATQKTVDAWLDKYALPFDIGIDPVQQWFVTNAVDLDFPTQIYVDPRTMRVAQIVLGVSNPTLVAKPLEALLTKNGAPPPDAGTSDAAAD